MNPLTAFIATYVGWVVTSSYSMAFWAETSIWSEEGLGWSLGLTCFTIISPSSTPPCFLLSLYVMFSFLSSYFSLTLFSKLFLCQYFFLHPSFLFSSTTKPRFGLLVFEPFTSLPSIIASFRLSYFNGIFFFESTFLYFRIRSLNLTVKFAPLSIVHTTQDD